MNVLFTWVSALVPPLCPNAPPDAGAHLGALGPSRLWWPITAPDQADGIFVCDMTGSRRGSSPHPPAPPRRPAPCPSPPPLSALLPCDTTPTRTPSCCRFYGALREAIPHEAWIGHATECICVFRVRGNMRTPEAAGPGAPGAQRNFRCLPCTHAGYQAPPATRNLPPGGGKTLRTSTPAVALPRDPSVHERGPRVAAWASMHKPPEAGKFQEQQINPGNNQGPPGAAMGCGASMPMEHGAAAHSKVSARTAGFASRGSGPPDRARRSRVRAARGRCPRKLAPGPAARLASLRPPAMGGPALPCPGGDEGARPRPPAPPPPPPPPPPPSLRRRSSKPRNSSRTSRSRPSTRSSSKTGGRRSKTSCRCSSSA